MNRPAAWGTAGVGRAEFLSFFWGGAEFLKRYLAVGVMSRILLTVSMFLTALWASLWTVSSSLHFPGTQ